MALAEFFNSLINSLDTGSGFWNPLVWGFALLIVFLVIYILRGAGKTSYKKGTEQTKPFLSGNPETSKESMHVKGENVYWGFVKSMKFIYDRFEKMHNGNVSDYILWFVIIMGIFFLVLGVI